MKRTQVLSFNSRTILDFSRFETVHFWIEIENNIFMNIVAFQGQISSRGVVPGGAGGAMALQILAYQLTCTISTKGGRLCPRVFRHGNLTLNCLESFEVYSFKEKVKDYS